MNKRLSSLYFSSEETRTSEVVLYFEQTYFHLVVPQRYEWYYHDDPIVPGQHPRPYQTRGEDALFGVTRKHVLSRSLFREVIAREISNL